MIEDLIRAGERSERSLAQTFNLGDKTVGRHRARHMVGLVAPRSRQTTHTATSAPTVPIDPPEDTEAGTSDPADVLRRQLAYLDGLSFEGLSPAQRVDLLEARRRTAESLAKMEPPSDNLVVTVNQVDGLPALFAKFHEALKEWPGARERLAEIWRESRGEALAATEEA